MKTKHLLLMLLMALLAPWAAQAQQALPYSYGFEDNDLSADGWVLQGATSSSTGISSSAAQTGSYGFMFNYSEQSAYLVSPILTGGNNGIALTLSYKEYSNSYGDEQFQVGYTTDETVTDAANFTYGSVVTASMSWQNYEYTFPAGTKRIAVKYIYNDALYLYLDDFIFEAPSSCPKPTGLTATANGQSATLTWIGDASSFHVAYSTDGTANPDDLTYTTVNTNSYTKDNLALDADHYFWVRAYCSATEQSNWAGPASVHIGYCVPAPTSVDGNGISNVTFGTGDYVVNNDTPKATYADYHTLIGAVQAGVESTIAITFATGYTYNTYVWVDLDNSLSFDADEVVCYGESTSANPTTLTLSFTIPADQTLGDFRLRIGSADSGLGTDPAAANPCYSSSYGCFQDYTLRVLEAPSCLTPTDLAVNYTGGLTATATWDGTADTYNIDVNGNVTNNVTAPYTINGLELATTYAVMVQANCSGNETSDWSNPVSFTTDLCLPENMCELTFVLNDSYGDGWSGSVINVIDVATGSVIAAMAANNHNVSSTPTSDTKTLNVCDGRELQFVWVNGGSSWDSEASYVVTDINGEVIFEGSGAMSEPVNYTVSCTISTCRKPTNLAASEIGPRSARLSWTENGEATAWIIKCNGEVTVREATNPYTLTRLEPETAYTVQVCPVCEVEKWSDEITFTTDVACPAPHNLAAGNITSNSAVISWTGEGASYDLRVGTIESSDRSTLTYGFEGDLEGWTTIDADGDGFTWVTLSDLPNYTTNYGTDLSAWAHGGSDAVLSGSFINGMSTITSDPDNLLVSPMVALGGSITFYAKGLDGNYPEHFGVCVSTTNNTDVNAFTVLQEWDTETDTEYHEYTVDLSAYVGMGYIAIRDFNVHDMYVVIIDDVTIEEGVTGGITWNDPITGVTSPYELTDLDPETQYFVQVRANCGDDGYSEWAQTGFRTKGLCDVPTNLTATNVEAHTATLNWNGVQNSYNVQYRTKAYSEELFYTDFDSGIPQGWTNTGGHYSWQGTSDYFVFLGYTAAETQYLVSSDLTAYEGAATIEFKQRYYGGEMAFQVGFSSTTTDVDAFTWGDDVTATASETLYSVAIPTGAKYFAIQVTSEEAGTMGVVIDDLGIYAAETPAGRWVSTTTTATTLDIAGLVAETEYEWQVQGINRSCDGGVTEWSEMATFTTAPSCIVPTNLDVRGITGESAIVSWESTADLFDIELNGTVTEGVTNPYDLVDLDPATIYTVRVRANCGVEDGYSDWTEPYAFVTECGGAKDLPYAYGFEDASELYACWSMSTADGNNNNFGISTYDGAYEGNSIFVFSSYTNYGTDYDQYLVSPELNAEEDVTVDFYYKTPNGYGSGETFKVGYSTDGTNFTWGEEISTLTTEWTRFVATYPAGTKYVAIHYYANYQYYLYVDNLRFRELTQMTELVEGWNWVSFYVDADDPIELLDKVKESLGEYGLVIEAAESNTEFDGEEWWGFLDDEGVYNEQMYLIEVIRDCTIELEGTPANPAEHEITIEPEYNWIGFPCAEEVEIAEALADFEAEEGDQIESAEGMTEFDGEEWWGSFDTFVPGQGYLYYSASDETKTLIFLTGAKKVSSAQPVMGVLIFKRQPVKAVNSMSDQIQLPNTKQVKKMK